MGIVRLAAKQLIGELTKSLVVVEFSDKVIESTGRIIREKTDNKSENKLEEEEDITFTMKHRPYTIKINNQFIRAYDKVFTYETLESIPGDNEIIYDPKYKNYVEKLKDNLIEEIESNISLRIGKWDILSYLSTFEYELKEIRKNFILNDIRKGLDVIEEIEETVNSGLDRDFIYYDNRNVKIIKKIVSKNHEELLWNDTEGFELDFMRMDRDLSSFWVVQVNVIDKLIKYIEPRKRIIETTEDYVKEIKTLSSPSLSWTRTDTDLLELIIALYEAGAIQNATKDLTQKEAIQVFSDFFGREIKDHYKKLNAARNRKKEDPGFIIKMQKALEAYYQNLNDKN